MFSINMAKKIVTNLRIDEEDWIQIKILAAESNMSVNEYVNWILNISISKASLGFPPKPKKSIYDLLAKLAKKKTKPGFKGKLSEDDKIIYEL